MLVCLSLLWWGRHARAVSDSTLRSKKLFMNVVHDDNIEGVPCRFVCPRKKDLLAES